MAVSLDHLGERYDNKKAQVLGEALDKATGEFLLNDKSPSRKVGELDNRGSHFYLAMYWAQALAEQNDDAELKAKFAEIATQLSTNEGAIISELNGAQGDAEDIGGYYKPEDNAIAEAMRPSQTLNQIIDSL